METHAQRRHRQCYMNFITILFPFLSDREMVTRLVDFNNSHRTLNLVCTVRTILIFQSGFWA